MKNNLFFNLLTNKIDRRLKVKKKKNLKSLTYKTIKGYT